MFVIESVTRLFNHLLNPYGYRLIRFLMNANNVETIVYASIGHVLKLLIFVIALTLGIGLGASQYVSKKHTKLNVQSIVLLVSGGVSMLQEVFETSVLKQFKIKDWKWKIGALYGLYIFMFNSFTIMNTVLWTTLENMFPPMSNFASNLATVMLGSLAFAAFGPIGPRFASHLTKQQPGALFIASAIHSIFCTIEVMILYILLIGIEMSLWFDAGFYLAHKNRHIKASPETYSKVNKMAGNIVGMVKHVNGNGNNGKMLSR